MTTPAAQNQDWSVLILTGGGSRRMGTDKARVTVSGIPLFNRIIEALPAHVPVIVSGPLPDPNHAQRNGLTVLREDPVGGGPAAGVTAALGAVTTPLVVVCAVDHPFAGPYLGDLATQLRDQPVEVHAVVPVREGRQQFLCAAYRTRNLRRATQGRSGHGQSMGALVKNLAVAPASIPELAVTDVDTPEALAGARRAAILNRTEPPAGPNPKGQSMNDSMTTWVAAVAEALDVPADVDIDVVLDVARDAAHQVQRPAAPVTTYLLGIAVAAGMSPQDAGARIAALAQSWTNG